MLHLYRNQAIDLQDISIDWFLHETNNNNSLMWVNTDKDFCGLIRPASSQE